MASINFVEVYIWRAKDHEGYTTTSSEGARHEGIVKEGKKGEGRVGHATMGIFCNWPHGKEPDNDDEPTYYASLWPRQQHQEADETAYRSHTIKEDIDGEGGALPDVIVRLHHLDIPKMITAFNEASASIDRKELKWVLLASDNQGLAGSKNNEASCASFVWSLLEIGGIDKPIYSMHMNPRGPKDKDFYNLTKCSLGQRFWGLFDGWPWTRQIFSPYALALRVTSAAEAYRADKEKTTEIMQSSRVAKEKEWTYRGVISQRLGAAVNHESNTAQTASLAAVATAAVLGSLAYAYSQRDSSRDDNRND